MGNVDLVSVADTFRLGDASLTVSGDESLLLRFRTILGDCASLADPLTDPRVRCHVHDDGLSDASVSFVYPGPRLELRDFFRAFPASAESVRAAKDDTLIFGRGTEWRGAVANLAINLTLAVQPAVLFFHAASVELAGRGILLAGRKEAGKSTTSLALAARGHRLLGDEIAGVRTESMELLPFPRSVSVREGGRATLIEERIRMSPAAAETYPDGSSRLRIRISDLFANVATTPVPLVAIFFLRPFGESTRIERFMPALDDAAQLEPLASALWGGDAASKRFRILRLLSQSSCYYLWPGSPDETAAEIEKLMEAA